MELTGLDSLSGGGSVLIIEVFINNYFFSSITDDRVMVESLST